jgi:hypothetical protein
VPEANSGICAFRDCWFSGIRAPTTNFLKKWSQSRVLGFYEALFAIMEAAFYAKRHLEGLGKC